MNSRFHINASFLGWGIPAETRLLDGVVPAGLMRHTVDWAKEVEANLGRVPNDLQDIVEGLRTTFSDRQPEHVQGWSGGGQILLLLIAEGVIKPNSIILYDTPYQLVTDDVLSRKVESFHVGFLPPAWTRGRFDAFRDALTDLDSNAMKRLVLEQFIPVVARVGTDEVDERIAGPIRTALEQHWPDQIPDWQRWIEIGESINVGALDLSQFQGVKVRIVHGIDDVLVPVTQARLLAQELEKVGVEVELDVLETGCHAPFTLQPEVIKQNNTAFIYGEPDRARVGASIG